MNTYAFAIVAAGLVLPAYADHMGYSSQPGGLLGWGQNSYGQTNCPAGYDFVAIAGGWGHSIALRSNGTLVGWGYNDYGETACPAGNTYVAIASGADHCLALRNDGTLVGWGYPNDGRTICPAGANFVAIAAGMSHSLALRSDGTLVGWGYSGEGETNCPAGTNFVAVAAGDSYSLALRNDGTLVGWGRGDYGLTNCPPGSNYVAIAAGSSHSLALRNDGTLVGWGDNTAGQTNCSAGSNYVAIAAGVSHSLALRSDGTLAAWGDNGDGQLNFPAGSNYAAIAAGYFHSLAVSLFAMVDISNEPFCVDLDTVECTIGGTNSPQFQAAGTMWWTNRANGAHGSFAADQSWVISGIPLKYGSNTIVVYGSNTYGEIALDRTVVIRGLSDQVVLVAPPDGMVTNTPSLLLEAFFGSAIVDRRLMTNATPVFDPAAAFSYTDVVSFREPGVYYWTAVGYDASSNAYYAPQTNCLTLDGARVRLVGPPSGTVLTNVLACTLVADYGSANADRQLSTNGGASWFDYDPMGPVVFPGAGTYCWAARGSKNGGWWYSHETYTLAIATNYSGAALVLRTPAQGSMSTNTDMGFSVVPYGSNFLFTEISIDNAAFALASFPTTMVVNPGMHTWTARGWIWPGPAYTFALATNTFTVIDPTTSSVTLIAPADGASLEQDYVFLDVLFCSVGGTQLSTNNGADWFAYQSPLEVPKGRCQWTARGTNGAGEWVYATITNTLYLYNPLVAITDPPGTVTVKHTVASCAISGTNNAYVVGSLMWTNRLTGASGSRTNHDSGFAILGIALGVGANDITVAGTNAWGVQASDSVTVHRKTLAESEPQIATNALIFPSAGSVLDAIHATDIVWRVNGIMDDAGGTNLVIANMSVLVRDDATEVAVAALDVSNVLGQTPWIVPASLVGGGTTYVLRFDVVDSDSLTGSMVFVDTPFTVVPEPTFIGVLAALAFIGLGMVCRKPSRTRCPASSSALDMPSTRH